MKRFFLITPLFVIAACATPGVEPVQSDVLQSPDSMHARQSPGDELMEPNSSAEGFEGIEDVEAPKVSETPAEMIPQVHSSEPEIICDREIPTGSRLPVEVCRRKSDIQQRQETDQRIFDRIKQRTAIGASRL